MDDITPDGRSTMPNHDFQPGMRFSFGDAITLAAAIGAAFYVRNDSPWLVHVIAYVVLMFFLFCNVFRVARTSELIWAIVFILLAGARLRMGLWGWPFIYGVSGTVAVVVIVAEMFRPSYHGLGWSRVNPGLRDWWKAYHPGDVDTAPPGV